VFNPLIQNTNQSYQMLATQMGRITYFFSPVQIGNLEVTQIQNYGPLRINERSNNGRNQGQQLESQVPSVELVAQGGGCEKPYSNFGEYE